MFHSPKRRRQVAPRLLDTRRLIEDAHPASGRDAAETQMVLNHKAAMELLVVNADTVRFNYVWAHAL